MYGVVNVMKVPDTVVSRELEYRKSDYQAEWRKQLSV